MPKTKERDARLGSRVRRVSGREAAALAEKHKLNLADALRAYLQAFIVTVAGHFVNGPNQIS